MTDTPKRLLLRLGLKLMTLCSAVAVGYVLFASIGDDDEPAPPAPLRLQLDLADATPLRRIPWSGGNLILLQRSEAILAGLAAVEPHLLDPHSRHAREPAGLPSPTRSFHPSLFVAYDRSTDLACPLQWVAPGDASAPLQPWPGGLRDSCGGSWYDASGRVLRGQSAKRNLDIPPYTFSEPDLLRIGISGDNSAPEK